MIFVINPKYKLPEGAEVINTTSRSSNWSRGLSPFFLGPVDLYNGFVSKNVENAWQFSKCYGHLDHLDENDDPTEDYFKWAEKGWNDTYAHRYPMGRGMKPLFSYWDGEKLSYVEARKKIYIPLYTEAVKKSKAFEALKKRYEEVFDLYLWDFDAHNLDPKTIKYWDLWNNPDVKVGHAYVLAMLLEGVIK